MGGFGGGRFLDNPERQLRRIRWILIAIGCVFSFGGLWSVLNGLDKGGDSLFLLIGIIAILTGVVIIEIVAFCAFGYSLSKKFIKKR